MEIVSLSRVAGTLRHGVFSGESRKKIIVAYIIMSSLFLIGLVAALVALIYEQKTNPGSILIFIFALISIILGLTAVPIICLFVILKNEKIRKNIYLWIADAVELKAFAKQIDICNIGSKFPRVKIQVNFNLNGVEYTRVSQGKQFGCGPDGYHYVWSEYANKKIDILYSKSYDQVIILKQSR